MKCNHCEQIQQYSTVDSREKLEKCSVIAYNYVKDGVLSIEREQDEAQGYSEKLYTCTHCGKKFVLWLDRNSIRTGGEWRILSN